TWRFCVLCRQSLPPRILLLARQPISSSSSRNVSDKSLQPSKPIRPGRSGLTEPLANRSEPGDSRRSADPNNELQEYIEYSKINTWHAAVGRSSPAGKQRWKYERLVLGTCAVIFLAYVYIRPENSIDEQFGMEEFGKGLFRPNPAMEHHIAATIQTVESRGGDASLYRNQLKILLKEKELQLERERQKSSGKADVKYDPTLHDIKY
ncbi:hypothetical protein BOX15_Mlig006887g1, partial [Macrostomum lignano]